MEEVGGTRGAVEAVGRRIVAASRSADAAAEESALCIATLLEQRRSGSLPLDTGLDELDLLASALKVQLAARAELFRARLALVRIPASLGVTGYGPSCPCDEQEQRVPTGSVLELIAA